MNLFNGFDVGFFAGHGYLLIGGLILVGGGLLIVSIVVNRHVAHSVMEDKRHREKLFEYYRNTFSQLGVILIGIGVSLFIFFFQQNYQDQRRRETEVQQILSRMAVRLSRAAAVVRSLSEYDELLDDGGPYKNPEDGGNNRAVTAQGPDLAEQVRQIRLVERDVELEDFSAMRFSGDFESSALVNELDPKLWFGMVEDENDVAYATIQLGRDYGDLANAIGRDSIATALADPEKAGEIKREVLDVFYDIDLLRDRSRRLVGRACRMMATGHGFLKLKPIEGLEDDYASHKEWLDQATANLSKLEAGGQDCFSLLHYESPDE